MSTKRQKINLKIIFLLLFFLLPFLLLIRSLFFAKKSFETLPFFQGSTFELWVFNIYYLIILSLCLVFYLRSRMSKGLGNSLVNGLVPVVVLALQYISIKIIDLLSPVENHSQGFFMLGFALFCFWLLVMVYYYLAVLDKKSFKGRNNA